LSEGQFWKCLAGSVHVDGIHQEIEYYQTELTTHLFMVRHPNKGEQEKYKWRYLRNMATVEMLKQLLLGCNPRRFNLLKEFLAASDILMSRYQYLKGWGETHCVQLKEVDGEKFIFPCWKLANKENITSINFGKTATNNSTELSHIKDGDIIQTVELNGLQITDVGEVITEGLSRLEGNVSTTSSEHTIQILVPGVVDMSPVSFKFEGWHTISVSVLLPPLFPKSKNGEQATKDNYSRMDLRGGNSFFRHTFPDAMPFHRPNSSEEMNGLISVEGGILTIHLKRELLESDITFQDKNKK